MNGIRVIRIAAFAFCFVLLLALAGIAESYYEQAKAAKLVAMISGVRVGETTEADARTLASPFSHFLDPHPSGATARVDSYQEFGFRNRAFAFLHLAPSKFVWVVLGYKNGVVAEKSAQYFEEPRCSGVVTETMRQPAAGQTGAESTDREIYLSSSVPSPVFIMKVRDNPSVPAARRQLDWQIDLSCMTKMGGCRDPRRVLRGALEPTG